MTETQHPRRRPATRQTQLVEGLKPLLDRVRAHIVRQFEFSTKMNAKKRGDFVRRAKRVDAYQEKILEAALRTIGVNPLDIRERQQKDFVLAQVAARAQKKQLIAHAKDLARERALKAKRLRALRERFENEFGNPILRLFLCERASHYKWITTFGNAAFDERPNITYEDATGRNVTRWRMRATAQGGDYGGFTAIFADEFVWQSDRDGVLDATAFFALNAVYDLRVEPKCIGKSEARLKVQPRIYVAQNASGSTDVILDQSGDYAGAVLDVDWQAGCQGVIDTGMALPLDTGIVALEQANFPIVANKPVLVTVTLVIAADASNDAAVEVDFASAPGLEMDTPFVALMVDS